MGYTNQKAILIFVFCIFLFGTISAENLTINGLFNSDGGIIQCDYNPQTNNCTFPQTDNTFYINGSQTITIPNKIPNLIIPADINLVIKDTTTNSSIVKFKDFNSIVISSQKSLNILNKSLSSIDVSFVNVPLIIINSNSKLRIEDNDTINFSTILKDNNSYRYTEIDAQNSQKIINLHSGNVDFSETKIINFGEINIDLDKTIYLSSPLASVDYSFSETDCVNSLFAYGGGMIYPKPLEDNDSNEGEDDSADTDTEEDQSDFFCYKYLNLDSCYVSSELYFPKANNASSTYLCFNITENKSVIFKDINASTDSGISIKSYSSVKRNIPNNKKYYLDDTENNTYTSFPDEDDPMTDQSDFIFNNYTGKVPQVLNNNRKGTILFQTCGPITHNTPTNLYNACKFIYIRPENFNVNFNIQNTNHYPPNQTVSKILNYVRYIQNCNYQSLEDALSNYLLVDVNQDVRPFIFGNIIKQNTGNTITPQFTNYGFYDINTTENRITNINNTINNNFFIFYLQPQLNTELDILKLYQFKFRLDANVDLNYSDTNLYYPFKLYK